MNKLQQQQFYLGNPQLKDINVKQKLSQQEINEFFKCEADVVYFAKHYIKIIHVDRGLIPLDLYDFQEDLIKAFYNNRFVICKFPRQSGKSTTAIAFLLHFLLFNKNVKVALLANKGQTARELLGRMQLAYMHLPKYMQQGITSWNKGSITLENGSEILATATSSSAIRGSTFNIIFLDEFAHIDNNMAEEFFRSSYPTISSGQKTKVFIVSTPRGMNMFWKLWMEATKPPDQKKSSFIPKEIHWSQVPGRDSAWRDEQIGNLGSEEAFDAEFGSCVTNTTIYYRDKNTLEVFESTLGKLYNACRNKI